MHSYHCEPQCARESHFRHGWPRLSVQAKGDVRHHTLAARSRNTRRLDWPATGQTLSALFVGLPGITTSAKDFGSAATPVDIYNLLKIFGQQTG
ncbi:hypothetical protein ANN_16460 [Periplaneta americana]|uniref:Uncharacterized protein n=1 Tax=Periplaneta americana TaxID=6978 RepID=A0ABQ8SJ14_PERAM|nr:hypothetical protein ANN_16460 [Periplaneta americana]